MNNNPNSPTRSTDYAHAGQPSNDNYPYYPHTHLPVCRYSRKKALSDGLQNEVSQDYLRFLRSDWDMLLPDRVFLTKKVMECCQISDTPVGQSEKGHLWLILDALEVAIGNSPENPIPFQARFGLTRDSLTVSFLAVWTTADVDDPMPVVTVMLPEEL